MYSFKVVFLRHHIPSSVLQFKGGPSASVPQEGRQSTHFLILNCCELSRDQGSIKTEYHLTTRRDSYLQLPNIASTVS